MINEYKTDLPYKENLIPGEIFWQSKKFNISIFRPVHPAIPSTEGNHLVLSENNLVKPWPDRNIKENLMLAMFALPVAKIIAEGRYSPDLWANIHFDRWGISVYGRNPLSENSWGQPVKKSSGNPADFPDNVADKIKRTLVRYLPFWENKLSKIKIFADGIKVISPKSPDYKDEVDFYASRPDPWKEDVIWVNEKFVIVNVGNPHLNGLHLVIHPREKYWKNIGSFRRPWQTGNNASDINPEYTQGFIEAAAILLGIKKIIIDDEKLPFYNPEIHFSGNWAADLLPLDKGGRLNLTKISEGEYLRKYEVRKHRVGEDQEFRTSTHGHLYFTDNPDRYVILPTRPKSEVPREWEGINPLPENQLLRIKVSLQGNLEQFLIRNCQGALSD